MEHEGDSDTHHSHGPSKNPEKPKKESEVTGHPRKN